ncbi:hypothetical protein [Komarekiella delphini-convector]|nr:hypothetical protein [Komarekiella delphini-convector]
MVLTSRIRELEVINNLQLIQIMRQAAVGVGDGSVCYRLIPLH